MNHAELEGSAQPGGAGSQVHSGLGTDFQSVSSDSGGCPRELQGDSDTGTQAQCPLT